MNKAERDARANISVEVLRAMESACPTSMMRNIALRDSRAPQGPSSLGMVPTSQQLQCQRPQSCGRRHWMDEGSPPLKSSRRSSS